MQSVPLTGVPVFSSKNVCRGAKRPRSRAHLHQGRFRIARAASDDLEIVAVAEHILFQRGQAGEPVEQAAADGIEAAAREDEKQRALNAAGQRIVHEQDRDQARENDAADADQVEPAGEPVRIVPLDKVGRLERQLPLFHDEIVHDDHADDRCLNERGNGDERAEVLFHTAPDGQRADIHHGDEHQHLIADLGHAALDDHAVDIGAGTLRADIRKRDQQQAQQREAGAAEVGEHIGRIALVHAGAHEHRQRHHAAGGDEKRRDHAVGQRCAPVAAALGLGQARQDQRLR